MLTPGRAGECGRASSAERHVTLSGLHILLAEDNPTNQMVAEQMLAALGATARVAGDGLETLALAEAERFDLALIDIEMPKLDGLEVIRRIRAAQTSGRDMPLIALTAYVMVEHRRAIIEAGADGVIAKPLLSVDQLGEDIRAILDARPAARLRPKAPLEPVAPAINADAAGIDARVFGALSRSIGPEAIPELLRKMDRDIVTVRERIQAGLTERDTHPLREATHILVAVAGSLGAVRLQNNAQCLNSAAHEGDFPEMQRLGRVVIAEIDLLRAFISSNV